MVKQLDLFSQTNLNITMALKEQLDISVKESGYSREQALDRINRLASRDGVRLMKGNGNGLTMATFEKWLNYKAREYIPSINALVIICDALEDMRPMQIVVRALGGELITAEDVKKLLWVKEHQKVKDARAQMKRLESEM